MIDRLRSLQFDKQLVLRQQVYRVRSDHPVTGGTYMMLFDRQIGRAQR